MICIVLYMLVIAIVVLVTVTLIIFSILLLLLLLLQLLLFLFWPNKGHAPYLAELDYLALPGIEFEITPLADQQFGQVGSYYDPLKFTINQNFYSLQKNLKQPSQKQPHCIHHTFLCNSLL